MIRLSLLVPTRSRGSRLTKFIQSVADNAEIPKAVEIVLLIDDDDQEMKGFELDVPVKIVKVIAPAGLTMGEMNRRCFLASSGAWVMLSNDDVIIRTKGWDRKILDHAECSDGFDLIHVNDGLFHSQLCTFPCVSRKFVEIIGGVCPADYKRYRIDDHIFHIFCLLGFLGHRRIIYLPGVLFEHQNYSGDQSNRRYVPDPVILKDDAATFERLSQSRLEATISVLRRMGGKLGGSEDLKFRAQLESAPHAFALRRRRFQRVIGHDPDQMPLVHRVFNRLRQFLPFAETQ